MVDPRVVAEKLSSARCEAPPVQPKKCGSCACNLAGMEKRIAALEAQIHEQQHTVIIGFDSSIPDLIESLADEILKKVKS